MDKPTPKERVEHVLEAIELIRHFLDGVNESSFLEDIKIQSAVQYQFLIIGEAIKNIDDRILAKYTYPWHIPKLFRNFIIQVSHGIRMERIYFAARDLDKLKKQMEKILKNEFR